MSGRLKSDNSTGSSQRATRNSNKDKPNSVTESKADKLKGKNSHTGTETLKIPNMNRDDPLFINLKSMMEETLNKSLNEFKEQISTRIDDLVKTNQDSIGQIKEDLRTKFDFLDRKITGFQENAETNFPKIDTRLTLLEGKMLTQQQQSKDLNAKIQEFSKSLEYHTEELSNAKIEIATLNEKSLDMENEIAKLSNENKSLRSQNQLILEKQNTLDNKQRRFNLVFEGVSEQKGENTKQVVIDLIEAGFADVDKSTIDKVYRIGNKLPNKQRPIVVVFTALEPRDAVLSSAGAIKKASTENKLWINKDLTDLSRSRSTAIRKCFQKLKEKKIKCQLQGSVIKLNGRTYGYDDLHNLPPGFRPEDSNSVITDNGSKLCFYGPDIYVSNSYIAPFYYKSNYFASGDQALLWAQARKTKNSTTADKILASSDPNILRRLAGSLDTNDQWKREEQEVLKEITKQRFTQNQLLLNKFLTDTHTDYYECSMNTKWGCGCKLDTIDLDPEILQGRNKFGNILTDLKKELASEYEIEDTEENDSSDENESDNQ